MEESQANPLQVSRRQSFLQWERAGKSSRPVTQVEEAENLPSMGQLWKGMEGKIKDFKSHPLVVVSH